MEITSFDEAQAWLFNRINYERTRPSGQTNPFRLEKITRLLELIGSPHRRIPAVHLAGTKGKGSTAAMLESILREHGIVTGLYTSPHIHAFQERMRVRGRIPSRELIVSLTAELAGILAAQSDTVLREPTFFEIMTLMAWMLFDRRNVELVVLETGLGGRLDCTNVCCPLLTVITSIGLDHMQILGDTIEQIASEKAGIIKARVPLITGAVSVAAADVISRCARERDAEEYRFGRDFSFENDVDQGRYDEPTETSQVDSADSKTIHRDHWASEFTVRTPWKRFRELRIPLAGEHQRHNASLAVMAAACLAQQQRLTLTDDSLRRGLRETHWPLRFEIFPGSPTIVLDAAHNPDSARAVARTIGSRVATGPRTLIFAASSDKDVRSMLNVLMPEFDNVILTRYLGNPRSVSTDLLQIMFDEFPGPRPRVLQTAETPQAALAVARNITPANGEIVATGSVFLAAEIRELVSNQLTPWETIP